MSASRATILVVDDDEAHSELVRRNLRRGGLCDPIVSLTNGNIALDYIYCRGPYAERSPEGDLLVVLDINMPGIDGIEVLRQIKSDLKTRTIPVLMLTTAESQREITRCYEYGCNSYITKSVVPTTFIETVRRLRSSLGSSNTPVPEEKMSHDG
jgi:CheY-like chemotaxis protein